MIMLMFDIMLEMIYKIGDCLFVVNENGRLIFHDEVEVETDLFDLCQQIEKFLNLKFEITI
jgi:hypothetical protein